ncbi:MAG: iron uptake system protein EfeO [Cardiobacteriaceae bacterium]|nr:iron uptake system protein EfeO [Cardiobacteriaceae bacterium]
MKAKISLLALSVLLATSITADAKEAKAKQAAQKAVEVSVNNDACEPMEITVPSGKVTFNIKNVSKRALEWEILKGVMVVDERENILPQLSDKLTVTLLPGEYQMTCGLLNNPRGKLIVTDSGYVDTTNAAELEKLAEPLAQYKEYAQAEIDELVKKTEVFVKAVKEGKVDEAKALFADTRVHYERVEPIAELFNELDPAIDAREDDYKKGAEDPEFTGFHRIEYALWVKNSTEGLTEIADRLEKDVKQLQTETKDFTFPPNKVVGGAATLIEEIAASKISGEEDRYSHTDLSDFQANLDGAKKIVDLFRKNIEEKDAKLLGLIDGEIKKIDDILAKYKTDKGFATYDKLSDADRNALKAPINTLAEELSKLRGLFGLD